MNTTNITSLTTLTVNSIMALRAYMHEPAAPVLYDSSTNSVIDTINKEGRGYFGTSLESLLDKYNSDGDLILIDYKDAHQRIVDAAVDTSPLPITAERYDEALNCLPPMHWTSNGGIETFAMVERLTLNVTAVYARDKSTNKYYQFHLDLTSHNTKSLNDEVRNLLANH